MLQAGRSRVRFPMRSLNFSINLILLAALGTGVYSASNINEYHKMFWDNFRLPFGTRPLFTSSGRISGYHLRPGHCLQVLGQYAVTI
jgi:hypothetical protein